MHLIWVQYFQILSLLLSIVFSKGLSAFKISGLIPLILIVCVTEFIGTNKSYFGWKNNYFVYDYYLLISFPLTFYIFYKMLAYTGLLRIIFFGFGTLVLIFFILNILFIQRIDHFDSFTVILSEFVITLLSLLVLVRLFKEDDFNILLYDHPYFWISGSSLIFGVSVLILLGLQQFIEEQKIQIDGKNIYRVITPIMNIVLYGSYSYAFFLCNRLVKKLSPQ